MKNNQIKKIMIMVLLIIIAFVSIKFISPWASSIETHATSLSILDDKKTSAMGLTTAVALTSTAITAIPGDVATPIANQISELTTPLMIVICAIYLEKFLLTITGFLSFTYLIPISCLCGMIYLFLNKKIWRDLAIKLALFAIVIVFIIPTSVKITTLIEDTFHESIQQTMDTVEKIEDEASQTNQEDSNALLDFLSGIGKGVSNVVDSAKNALSIFVDAIAVLIITSCVIPICVIFMFIWCIKLIWGIPISIPTGQHKIGFHSIEKSE